MNKFMLISSLLLSGCTLSFSNIDTHGSATDLIDETLSTQPDLSADVKLVP